MTVQAIDSKNETKATIFDIQSFSLHDGPGIRTSVFLKGCSLRCEWCHNPESISFKKQLMFCGTMCVGCMQCVAACPTGAHIALERESDIVHVIDWEKCNACGKCTEVCCYDALSIVGQEYTPQQLLKRVQNDFVYFMPDEQTSETGGITFTGGEPMLYPKFIKAFAEIASDIHIAVETSGNVPTENFELIVDKVGLFLFDYKATNPKKHREFCGADNEQILKNLDYLYQKDAHIVLRLPLIPGINDDDEHLHGIADLLKKYPNIKKAEIMPYHNLGLGKRLSIGLAPQKFGENNADEDIKVQWLQRINRFGAYNVDISK